MAYNLAEIAKRVRRLIDSKPRITLQEVAQSVGVERHTVEKAIRLEFARSFRAVQQRSTLRKARALLLQSPMLSVKEVAFALGYRSPQAFSRFCRALLGCSPVKLRAKILNSRAKSKDWA
jgi:two-component system response regulator YesN